MKKLIRFLYKIKNIFFPFKLPIMEFKCSYCGKETKSKWLPEYWINLEDSYSCGDCSIEHYNDWAKSLKEKYKNVK